MRFQPVDRLADDNIVQAKHVIMLFLAIIEKLAPQALMTFKMLKRSVFFTEREEQHVLNS